MKRLRLVFLIILLAILLFLPGTGIVRLKSYQSSDSQYSKSLATDKYDVLMNYWTYAPTPTYFQNAYISENNELIIQVTRLDAATVNYFSRIIKLDHVQLKKAPHNYKELLEERDRIWDIVCTNPTNDPFIQRISAVEMSNGAVNLYIIGTDEDVHSMKTWKQIRKKLTTSDKINVIAVAAFDEPAESDDPVIEPVTQAVPEPQDPAVELLSSMSLREKVGQMFMIRPDQLISSIKDETIHDPTAYGIKEMNEDLLEVLERYPAGGFALFGKNIESPEQVRTLTSQLSQTGPVIPFIAVDEEGGDVARLANQASFDLPKVGTMESIGATNDPDNAYHAASQIGQYLTDLGFNMDFAPVADINTNPQNRVIGSRSFGSDPDTVSMMVNAYINGLHDQGILSTVKHFPGHGDTSTDTHNGSVIVSKTWDELLACECIPFIENADNTDAVMVAHISLENISGDHLPTTLSSEIITQKLRGELGYDGIIITDSLAMAAITENYGSGEAAILAIEAGNDILLLPADYAAAFDAVVDAVKSGRIPEERIDESVLRILRVKLNSLNSAQQTD